MATGHNVSVGHAPTFDIRSAMAISCIVTCPVPGPWIPKHKCSSLRLLSGLSSVPIKGETYLLHSTICHSSLHIYILLIDLAFSSLFISLLKEAQPSTEKGSKDSTTVDRRAGVTLQSNEGEESSERLAQEERQLLSRYGTYIYIYIYT